MVEDLESGFKVILYTCMSEPPNSCVYLIYKSKENLYIFVIIKFSKVIRNFEFMLSDTSRRLDFQKSIKNLSYRELLQTGAVFS